MAIKPSVYIIIVNWNGWCDTLVCLNSIRNLHYSNFRIILVDNASTDGSISKIKAAQIKLEIIESNKNLGFGGGCNLGIRRAFEDRAKYVWLVNSDTMVDPRALSALVEVAESDSRLGGVGSVLYYMNDPDQVQAWGGGQVNLWLGVVRHFYSLPTQERRLDFLTGASLLLRCSALNTVGIFDDRYFLYWEDTDLCFRLRKAGWKLATAPTSKLLHKESASLGKKSPTVDAYFSASAVLFFKKHAAIPILPIVFGIGGRFLKRVIHGDLKRARAVWQGFWSAILIAR